MRRKTVPDTRQSRQSAVHSAVTPGGVVAVAENRCPGGFAILVALVPLYPKLASVAVRSGDRAERETVTPRNEADGIMLETEDIMILPEFLSQDADGYIHVAGHRIGLQDLVYYYNEGHSAEALWEMFPTLTLALIHKLIAFYLEHRMDVDAYVARGEAEMAQQRAAATNGPDLAELRRRLAAKQTAGA